MDAKVAKLLNEQVNKELYSAYLYLDISNFYDSETLDGFANWFRIQAMEERDHAMMIMDFLLECDEKVELMTVAKPDKVFNDLLAPLKASLEHEKFVTASITNIYKTAVETGDIKEQLFLNWFITEQGEEEKNASDLVCKMEIYGDDKKALYLLNTELAARVYTPATQGSAT